jgi:hypothetical protein
MALACNCPVPTAPATIITELEPCGVNFGQTQKMIFWRTGNTISTASAVLEATWTGLLAATGDTKAVVSPFIGAPTTDGGEPIEFGSGNEVRNGIPIIIGSEPITFDAMMYGAEQSVIALFKELMCDGLEVILINSDGKFGAKVVGTAMSGFPITSLFVGDKKLGGYDSPDTNALKWRFKPNWSDAFAIVDPTANFSALTLINL